MKQTKYLLIFVLSLALIFSAGTAQVQAAAFQQEDTPPPAEADVVGGKLAAGGAHTCWIKIDGQIGCVGKDDAGQSTSFPGGTFLQVTTGENHSCGLASDGTVTCWGDDSAGQSSGAPGVTFLQITAGVSHTCGIKSNGYLECWGSNFFDQLNKPGGRYKQISAGDNHTCGIRSDGIVKCWGLNTNGQSTTSLTDTYRMVSAGGRHSCGIQTDGELKCWGANGSKQSSPPGGLFVQLDSGENHSCALRSDGMVNCWGSDIYGQSTNPTGTFDEVSAGDKHSCGIASNSERKCWGDNTYGQVSPPVIRGNAGAPAVILKYVIDGDPKTLVTDNSGNYAISVPYHWTGTITPEKTGYSFFKPASRSYTDLTVSKLDQDFLAYQRTKHYSIGAFDGHVTETAESSNVGGTTNAVGNVVYVGDSALNQQHRTVISFDTSSLPDNAIVTKATVRLKKSGITGTDPFTTHGNLVLDINTGGFSGSEALQSSDFEASAKSMNVGSLTDLGGNTFQCLVNTNVLGFVSKTGNTQFRLRFQVDDNDDLIADYVKFFSGNYTTLTLRPFLVLEYYVPMK